MAYILKSNIVVNNPEHNFEYVTPLGLAGEELSAYYNKILSLGYSLSQSEFDSLKTFQQGMESIGQWENIEEYAPLIGNTVAQVAVKYKYKNSQSAEAKEGLSDSNVDGKGLVFIPRVASYPPALDLKYSSLDSFNSGGGGLISYHKNTTSSFISGQRYTIVHGGGLFESYSSIDGIYNTYLESNMLSPVEPNAPMVYLSKYEIVSGEIRNRRTYVGGVIAGFSDTPIATTSPSGDTSAIIGGRIGAPGARSTYGFEGNIRLVILHNGKMPESSIPQVSQLFENLVSGLGKTIV